MLVVASLSLPSTQQRDGGVQFSGPGTVTSTKVWATQSRLDSQDFVSFSSTRIFDVATEIFSTYCVGEGLAIFLDQTLVTSFWEASGNPTYNGLVQLRRREKEKTHRCLTAWPLLNNSIQCMFNSIIHHHSHCLFHYKLVQLHFLSLLLTSVFVRVPGNPKTFVSCSINTCNVMDLCHKQRVLITAPRQSLA